MDENINAILGERGVFSEKIKGFQPRQTQLAMANAVSEVICNTSTLLAESGTGTGKTYAYLVPCVCCYSELNKKTIISTGTKHLQEQLFHRDIPEVVKALGASIQVSLLKGRANYLCLHRYHMAKQTPLAMSHQQVSQIEKISHWLSVTQSGDIAEQSAIPEESSLWSSLTSTVENCIGQECTYFEDCYINKARKKAMRSDIVVINHHLFFADKVLKEDGFGALLPDVDTIIFDEAHQVPDIASNFLGNKLSSWQFIELSKDIKLAELKERSLVKGLESAANEIETMVSDYRLSFGLPQSRVSWREFLLHQPNVMKKFDVLLDKLSILKDLLEQASPKGENLTRCYERAVEVLNLYETLVTEQVPIGIIRWVELASKSFRIHETPLNIGDELQQYFYKSDKSMIFTSATLSVNQKFDHFISSVGVHQQCRQYSWDSPFDYFNQAVMYVPKGVTSIKDEAFSQSMFDEVLPIIQASQGRTFLLFTSFKVMSEVEKKMREHGEFSIWVQGQQNKLSLLKQFVKTPKSVLLGTMSFWEGVDVPGEALTTVIIDKLPFESPFDPVLKARLEAMKKNDGQPFRDYQIPRAVILLRQGVGRLIRNQSDKGVLVICDKRLTQSSYGRIFLDSLPRMRRTQDQEKVCGFLSAMCAK